jgi:serine protease Do
VSRAVARLRARAPGSRGWPLGALAVLLWAPAFGWAQSDNVSAIEHVKPSIVAVGSFERLRNPEFEFRGTGFAVGDGSLIATNEHVVSAVLDSGHEERLAIAVRLSGSTAQIRSARKVASEPSADLALLKIDGPPLPALRIGNSDAVREGEIYLFTGFPIGTVLGLIPATSRAMISAITPIVIPAARADKLDARAIRRLAAGAFPVFQLDGTAYPGNSGSPVYDPRSEKVIGIVNMVFVKGTKEAALTNPSGISYAIPAQKLKELLARTR